MIRKSTLLTVRLLCVLLVSASLCSHARAEALETQETVEAEQQRQEAEESEGEVGEEEEPKNEIAFSIGSTEAEEDEEGEKGDPDFTLAFDYERRLTKLIGVGVLVDWVAEGRREFLIGVPVFFHPWKGARFELAAVVERVREDKEYNPVLRTGFGWVFETKSISITPTIIYDFVEGQNFVVIGVGFGRSW